MHRGRLVSATALLILGACAPASTPAPAPAPTTAKAKPAVCPARPGLCLEVDPPGAALVVNGEDRGTVESLGPLGGRFFALAPGFYQIMLKHDGYATWRAEVSVRDTHERIAVRLEPR